LIFASSGVTLARTFPCVMTTPFGSAVVPEVDNLPPLLGGTVFFQETLKPAAIIHTIRRQRISVLVAVPRILQALKEKIERDLRESGQLEKFRENYAAAADKHFLRRWWIFRRIHRQFGFKFWAFISGGAALDRETEEFWARLGFAV